ncbi:MAG: restriction endonuclease [Hyphomonas sp.]|uniref:EcoRII N-terminal effector-binding domain-containing protein n=1 Tax=Hyphomonas sp. TaxID=87 RepID=UPI001B10AD1F|nr:EcoRII N-terminal effector-binding domain-containing protein [Hyphomonas sp.]MBO6584194.1 restriction endonuclease [Hyphomonas sp.]
MTEQIYEKLLTANDTGETGGHQAGIHIPKSQSDLIRFLPALKPDVKNPDAWLNCIDDSGVEWSFRYVYYNNKFHDPAGTRDEYRITHMTKFFRAVGGAAGDVFSISGRPGSDIYRIHVEREKQPPGDTPSVGRIRLKGWRRVH